MTVPEEHTPSASKPVRNKATNVRFVEDTASKDKNDLDCLVRDVDELSHQQALAEAERVLALDRIALGREDMKALEAALHAALRHTADLDDQLHDCKALINERVQEQVTQEEAMVVLGREERHLLTDIAGVRAEVEERCAVIADLKRRLLSQGFDPDRLSQMEEDAMIAAACGDSIGSNTSSGGRSPQCSTPTSQSSSSSFSSGAREERLPWYRKSGGMLRMLKRSLEKASSVSSS